MGGIHVGFRKSNACAYKAVESVLTLPTTANIAGIPNDATSGKGSVVPMFYHGMYNSSNTIGFDVGIFYANGAYRLFLNSLKDGWAQDSSTFTANGGTFIMKTLMVLGSNNTKYVKLEIAGKRTCDFKISDTTYNALNGSARIHRELNIATNPVGSITALPKVAYFKNAKFSDTKMTDFLGNIVPMGSATSSLLASYPDPDPGQSSNYGACCDSKQTTANSGNFANDTASCTFAKASYPI